jgi:Leucine-rich repeat (LRR) protein
MKINNLSFIDSSLFRDQKNLKYIYFEYNFIENLDPNIFNGLVRLVALDFSRNIMRLLDSSIFKGLHNLKFVNFESNFFENFDSELTKLLAVNFENKYGNDLVLGPIKYFIPINDWKVHLIHG